ncbi:hypothetical protein PENFLA_c014G08316 [Penicillium flavigenum]|uniref:Uncharacterized protein n=1 Tax=Penicillium flavigenum TaxID=254877 RepID=A0A1V6T6I7_9EURO|nr:hypothetical protein PENFLA_c014G08316 [Penicillium flavigenum]
MRMGKDTQDIEWYSRWVKQVKEEFKQYNSGEATLTQLDATISQVPSAIKTQAWMDPHQFITLPQVFFDDLAMTSEMIESRDHSGENEAQARTIVAKLLEAVYKGLRLSGFAGPNDIRMLQKTAFTFYPMEYRKGWKCHKVRCMGRTDFSFYFGDEEAQAINLVIEARPKGNFNGEG